jgi:hypothetical protein
LPGVVSRCSVTAQTPVSRRSLTTGQTSSTPAKATSKSGKAPAAHACVLRFEESLAHALADSLREARPALRDPDTAAHLIVQTTESLAHRFVLRGIHELGRSDFVAELTRLLAAYVGVAPARGSRS